MKKILFIIAATLLCTVACTGNKSTSKSVSTDSDSVITDSDSCGLTSELEDSIDSVNHIQY